MFGRLKKLLFNNPAKDGRLSVHDPVLGELNHSDHGEWWEGSVEFNDRHVGFGIGGEAKPDERLLKTARHLLERWTEFESELAAFLVSEIRANDFFVPYGREIQQLIIAQVCFFRPERPEDGMIYFNKGEGGRLWRCDYVDGKPQNLGFDD